MTIIPAIDIIDGRCVRLQQGDFSRKTVYHANPVDIAQQFEAAGCTRLHLVDLDGARRGQLVNTAVIEGIATHTSLVLDVGGGIRTQQDVATVFACGARYATVGSIAVENSVECAAWLAKWGADAFVLGLDSLNGKVAVYGWEQRSVFTVEELLAMYGSAGLVYAMCTDISRDGMLQGPSVAWYAGLQKQHPDIQIIASGGVGSIADVQSLQRAGVCSVVVGRALYEGGISLQQIAAWNAQQCGGMVC